MAKNHHRATAIDYGLLPAMVGFNLRLAYFVATQLFAEAFTGWEITPIQFALLEIVSRNPHLTQKEIAKHIGTKPSVLVIPIRKLEERGFIVRERSQNDRRHQRVCVTEAGLAFQNEARIHIRSVEDPLLAQLSASEQKTLLQLLGKIAK